MRDELYGDRKDIIKWSLVEKCCREKNITDVYYAVMLCAPLGKHGHDRSPAELSHPSIQGFFEQERSVFGTDPSKRTVARIMDLPARTGLKLSLECCLDSFPGIHRGLYFKRVLGDLASKKIPQLVLVDPDNGVQGIQISGRSCSKPTRQRITPKEIRDIVAAVQPGSIALVYQDHFRNSDWVEVAIRSMQDIAGAAALVTAYPFNGVVFLAVEKP